ncbi:MAG: IS3 family transposase, partial [Gammaproteobacteria bacterium]|nr:IS3 family transposase [Gammaproteobacteria bacterium]
VSRSGYYDWLKQYPSERQVKREALAKQIKDLFIESRSSYGTRRLKKALNKLGVIASRRRIGKLMKEQQICCKKKRSFKVTTDSNHSLPIAENKLQRNFNVAEANQVYVGDITYVHTQEGWLYLATVIVMCQHFSGHSFKKLC